MGVKELTHQRPSSEYARWLRAVCSDPYDASPRLAYADWLEENSSVLGSPRADLIRVQCALAGLGDDGLPVAHDPGGDCCCRPCALRRRERELLAWATDALLPAGWAAVAEPGWLRVNVGRVCLFRWGFAEAAVMRAEDLVPTPGAPYPHPPPPGPYPPGLLLFRSEPLTAVTLAGKRPRQYDNGDWGWWDRKTYRQDADDLPTALWDRLRGGQPDGPPPAWMNYPTEAAARGALSRACVDSGRAWAGLPALAWGPLPGAPSEGSTGTLALPTPALNYGIPRAEDV